MTRLPFAALALCLLATGASADATVPTGDLEGARDNPLLKRYEGAYIVSFDQRAFDELTLPLAPLKADPQQRDAHNNIRYAPAESRALEGRVTRLVYLLPAGRSPLEAVRNYRQEIESLGGKALFECKREECGGAADRSSSGGGGDMSLAMVLRPEERLADPPFSNGWCATTERIKDQRYLAAELPEQGAHVSVLAYALKGSSSCEALAERTVVVVDLVETKAREQKMVTVDAAEMARTIAASGRIALYGILFDFNKATLKPESTPVLVEIAALLKSDPKLKLLVVGHTDNAGSFEYNRDLSQHRAESVVAALVRDRGIDKARLRPLGVSFAAPVASNASEEGRAQNRRVELVQY